MSESSQIPARRGLTAAIEAMRPTHWLKNGFVLVPVLFSEQYLSLDPWWRALVAMASFCLISSSVYLVNDVCDRAYDRQHPDKCRRAVASGRLSVHGALVAAVVCVLTGLALAFYVAAVNAQESGQPFGVSVPTWAGLYLVLVLAYSLKFKQYVILDVILISLGFVLRAMAGAAAIDAPISPWLVLCTFTLCLFVALTKRRAEIEQLPDDQAQAVRRTNRAYRPEDFQYMLAVSAALALVTYSLYCVAPGTVHRIGSAHLIWTVPLVVYGVFRYDRVSRRLHRGDVVNILLGDRVMWLVLLAYAALVLAVLQFGAHPILYRILDVRLLYP
jgi:4-hydroxybenzoate polyprenyltransferase